MERVKYIEIDVAIVPKDGAYKVSVSSEPGGDASCTFSVDELRFDVDSSIVKPESSTGASTKETLTSNTVDQPTQASDGLPPNLSLIRTQPPSLAVARAF